MPLTIVPANAANPEFGGVVTGVDLRVPLTPEQVGAIEAGMNRFAVLAFPDQPVSDEEQLAFSRNFGPLEQATGDIVQGAQRRLRMELNDISNLDRDGRLRARDDRARLFGLGNRLWHSDSSFKEVPAKYSLLSARVVPDRGGDTQFADMRAAWDTLDAAVREEIRDLVCDHSQMYSRGILGFDFTDEDRVRWAPVQQRLVRKHPVTGRLSLFLSSHAGTVHGMPVPEARALLRDLMEHATQRERVYAHRWRVFDLVMWDNRSTMHRATNAPVDQVRDMRRTTIESEGSTMQQAAE